MKIVLIQVVLIVVVIAVAARLFRSRGERSQAAATHRARRASPPSRWSRSSSPTCGTGSPRSSGVGRGTDVVLYALVVAFLSFGRDDLHPRSARWRRKYTRLARRIALDEAELRKRRPEDPGT